MHAREGDGDGGLEIGAWALGTRNGMTLEELRKQIDVLDQQLVELLSDRPPEGGDATTGV